MDEDRIARERIKAVERRLARDEAESIRRFNGFPQEYASRIETDALETKIEAIRLDHVQRREIEEIKTSIAEGAGRRAAGAIAVAVIVTILGITFGIMWKAQLTHGDVSAQIHIESPWAHDRLRIEARLSALEQQNAALKLQLTQIQTLDAFFCRTRQPALPGC